MLQTSPSSYLIEFFRSELAGWWAMLIGSARSEESVFSGPHAMLIRSAARRARLSNQP